MSFHQCSNIIKKYNLGDNDQSSFFNFVFKKISEDTKKRFVVKGDYSIDIIPFSKNNIKVIPIWKEINPDNPNIRDEMKLASEIILNTDAKCIYFVYPRNSNFTKHTEVKIRALEKACSEYVVKLIPYSLLIKNKLRRCSGNSNILCK